MPVETGQRPTVSTRENLLRAAIDLLNREGRGAVSTRAVSAAAGIRSRTAGLREALRDGGTRP
jgi:AcrR family transcriptional regulator